MLPPYTYVAGRLAEERAKDVMREGEHARLVRIARPVKRGLVDRLVARLGDGLASHGERLRARHPLHKTHLPDSPVEASQ